MIAGTNHALLVESGAPLRSRKQGVGLVSTALARPTRTLTVLALQGWRGNIMDAIQPKAARQHGCPIEMELGSVAFGVVLV